MALQHLGRILCCVVAAAACAGAAAAAPALPPAAGFKVDFVKDVQPILAARCVTCHGAAKQRSEFRLDVKSIALKGGDSGKPAVIPGDAAASPLIRYVAGLDDKIKMPAEGEPLSAEQVGVLRTWVEQGAKWPDSASAKLPDRLDHWAFKPPVRPEPPAVKDAGLSKRVRNPVDAFVLARLEKAGLQPSPEADRRTLVRRLYFDLTGLP